jgi:Ca2+:H+ antiporter
MSQRSPRRSHNSSYNDGVITSRPSDAAALPTYNRPRSTMPQKNNGNEGSGFWNQPAGESGRRGFHPLRFFQVIWRSASRASMLCNLLWPVVPAALAVRCRWMRCLHLSPRPIMGKMTGI